MKSMFGRSDVRQRLLGEFFAHPGLEMHVRDAARRVGGAASHVGRELEQLQGERVLESRTVGRSRIYKVANTPVAKSVRELFDVTLGIEGQLAAAVKGVRGVEEAYVFGSRARRAEGVHSDVDLLVVGDRVDRATLFGRLSDIERRIGREIEVVQVTQKEWAASESAWLRDVRSKPIVSVIVKP